MPVSRNAPLFMIGDFEGVTGEMPCAESRWDLDVLPVKPVTHKNEGLYVDFVHAVSKGASL